MWEFSQDSVTNQLKVDQALLNVTSSLNKSLWLYQLSDECIECPYKKLRKIPAHDSIVERINTQTQMKWSLFNSNVGPYAFDNSTPICIVEPKDLGEFGIYNLTVNQTGCSFHTHRLPVNRNWSILWALIFILLLYIVIRLLERGIKYYTKRQAYSASTCQLDNSDVGTSTASPTSAAATTTTQTAAAAMIAQKKMSNRLISLDAFRGLAIVTMVFANAGCGEYFWLEHATWNGLNFADFIFPAFLWIMGVCIPFSLKSQFDKNIPRQDILGNILIRSIKLFLIGLLIHTAHGPDMHDIRIMGVLQRFGVAYLVVASIQALHHKQVTHDCEQQNQSWHTAFLDITTLSTQWTIMLVITIVHLVIVFVLPVKGCPHGYFGPGGVHEMGRYNNCIGGAIGFIDRLILGEEHMYQGSRAARVYDEKMPFDPEGPFGCLLTVVHVFFGVQCGNTLLIFIRPMDRIKRMLSWAIISILCGCVLCKFSINDGLIPINKHMWSLSFVLVTCGFSFLLFTLFYVIIDVKKFWSGKPLTFAGMNAILIYIGSEILGRMYPFYWQFRGTNTHLMFLFMHIWQAACWNLIAYYLFTQKVFLSL